MSYEIKRGVIPPQLATPPARGRPTAHPFEEMAVGTFIEVERADGKSAAALCYTAMRRVPGSVFRHELLRGGRPVTADGKQLFAIWRVE
jgi:hypothetical protein